MSASGIPSAARSSSEISTWLVVEGGTHQRSHRTQGCGAVRQSEGGEAVRLAEFFGHDLTLMAGKMGMARVVGQMDRSGLRRTEAAKDGALLGIPYKPQ